jgi:hypothetical protein
VNDQQNHAASLAERIPPVAVRMRIEPGQRQRIGERDRSVLGAASRDNPPTASDGVTAVLLFIRYGEPSHKSFISNSQY